MLDNEQCHVLTYARVTPEGAGIIVSLNMSAKTETVTITAPPPGLPVSATARCSQAPRRSPMSAGGTRITLPPYRGLGGGGRVGWRPAWRARLRRARAAELAIDASTHVSARWLLPPGGACLLRARARRRGRHGAAVPARRGDRACRARHCHPALPVSLCGTRFQATGSAAPVSCDGARRGGRSAAAGARVAALCRRPLLWRPHDLAGAGTRAAVRRCAASCFWVSHCIRPANRHRSGPSICCRCRSRCCSCRARGCARRTHLLEAVLVRLGARASVQWVAAADHSFHVPARSGMRDAPVRAALLAAAATWMARTRE